MALPNGQISMSQVNAELGNPESSQISLNDSAVRNLAEKPSGQISMSDLHGKSSVPPAPPVSVSAPSAEAIIQINTAAWFMPPSITTYILFRSPGTFTTSGTGTIYIDGVGGGGGGGSSGGGGGGYVRSQKNPHWDDLYNPSNHPHTLPRSDVPVTHDDPITFTVSIGTGGAGSANGRGTKGGNTTVSFSAGGWFPWSSGDPHVATWNGGGGGGSPGYDLENPPAFENEFPTGGSERYVGYGNPTYANSPANSGGTGGNQSGGGGGGGATFNGGGQPGGPGGIAGYNTAALQGRGGLAKNGPLDPQSDALWDYLDDLPSSHPLVTPLSTGQGNWLQGLGGGGNGSPGPTSPGFDLSLGGGGHSTSPNAPSTYRSGRNGAVIVKVPPP